MKKTNLLIVLISFLSAPAFAYTLEQCEELGQTTAYGSSMYLGNDGCNTQAYRARLAEASLVNGKCMLKFNYVEVGSQVECRGFKLPPGVGYLIKKPIAVNSFRNLCNKIGFESLSYIKLGSKKRDLECIEL